MAVARATKIDKRRDARCADGYVNQTQAPGAAERVADDDGEAFAGLFAHRCGEAAGGAVGIFREQGDAITARDIRMVDACIGADETVMGFNDQDAVGANDAARLAKDYLDKARIVGEFLRQHCWPERKDRPWRDERYGLRPWK